MIIIFTFSTSFCISLGLYVDFKKIVRRSGGSNSEVCSITSSIAHTADLLSEEEGNLY